jgi:hypothetical protein
LRLDAGDFKPGIYLLRVSGKGINYAGKVMIR